MPAKDIQMVKQRGRTTKLRDGLEWLAKRRENRPHSFEMRDDQFQRRIAVRNNRGRSSGHNINRRRFRTLEIGSRAVQVVTSYLRPEARGRYECGTPVAADVCGDYQVSFHWAKFEDFCKSFWWKAVDWWLGGLCGYLGRILR